MALLAAAAIASATLAFLLLIPSLRERLPEAVQKAPAMVGEGLAAVSDAVGDRAERVSRSMTRELRSASASRVALVVGNGRYEYAKRLNNPANDAGDMATKLDNLGFDVVVAVDLDRDGLFDKVREFHERARRAEVSLFYYAGHGLQVDGANYLVPVDAQLEAALQVSQRAMALDDVMGRMDSDVNLVFLDACRNNPLAEPLARSMGLPGGPAANRGLAAVRGSGEMLIAYATEPGAVAADGEGDNSPFTAALLDHLDQPGLSVNDVLTLVQKSVLRSTNGLQRPWTHSSLSTIYRLVPGETGSGPLASTSLSSGDLDPAAEMWIQIRGAENAGAVRDFLAAHPNSPNADAARALLNRLSQPFTVLAEPAGARVRITNIATRYTPGMRLAPSDYQVEVSADGYETTEELVRHGSARPTVHRVVLAVDREQLTRAVQQGLVDMGFRADRPVGHGSSGLERALEAFFEARGLSNLGTSKAALTELERANADGFRNFIGCKTERIPRTVFETRRVPSTTSEWVDERRTVREELRTCTAAKVCAGLVDFYGRTARGSQQVCGRACLAYVELTNLQGVPPYVVNPLEDRCNAMATTQLSRAPRISDVTVQRCTCPVGDTACSCEFRARCSYEIQMERTEFDDVVTEATVMEEKEVCRCRAPEVAGRDCVRAS